MPQKGFVRETQKQIASCTNTDKLQAKGCRKVPESGCTRCRNYACTSFSSERGREKKIEAVAEAIRGGFCRKVVPVIVVAIVAGLFREIFFLVAPAFFQRRFTSGSEVILTISFHCILHHFFLSSFSLLVIFHLREEEYQARKKNKVGNTLELQAGGVSVPGQQDEIGDGGSGG
jgi:hypothetical protein